MLRFESFKEVVVEGNRVAVAEPGVELECEQDKESGTGELDRPTPPGSDVENGIAKADKFVEQEVITASFGRIM